MTYWPKPDSYDRVHRFMEAVEAFPEDDDVALLDLVSSIGLTYNDFAFLDETPGAIDGQYRRHNWHRRLRVVRNDPALDLFERIQAATRCPKHRKAWLPGTAPDGRRRCAHYVPDLGVSEDYGCPQS